MQLQNRNKESVSEIASGGGSDNHKHSLKAQGGLSLIELIVVIAIMAVLAGLLAPALTKYAARYRNETCRHQREALLEVYARCVLDQNLIERGDITFDVSGLKKVIPNGAGVPTLSYIANEVAEYAICPNNKGSKAPYTECGVEPNGTAWIKCNASGCGDMVSVDLMSIGAKSSPSPATDVALPSESPSPSVSPSPSPSMIPVTYDMHGHGALEVPASTEYTISGNIVYVKEGDRAPKPKAPIDANYTFKGWADDANYAKFNSDPTKLNFTQFNFFTDIDAPITIHALWLESDYADRFWPYADNEAWWNTATVGSIKDSRYAGHDQVDENGNMDQIYIKAPSGIFPSRQGGKFVVVPQNGVDRHISIKKQYAISPEYYYATQKGGGDSQGIIPLTGHSVEVDVSASGRVDAKNVSPGDLVIIRNGAATYTYVFWHSGMEDINDLKASEFAAYPWKVRNMYRVDPY